MIGQSVTFETLPAAVGRLIEEVNELKGLFQENFHVNHLPSDETYDVAGAAKYLRIAEQTIYQNIKKIPHSKRFGKLYFLRSELEDYLAAGKVKTRA